MRIDCTHASIRQEPRQDDGYNSNDIMKNKGVWDKVLVNVSSDNSSVRPEQLAQHLATSLVQTLSASEDFM